MLHITYRESLRETILVGQTRIDGGILAILPGFGVAFHVTCVVSNKCLKDIFSITALLPPYSADFNRAAYARVCCFCMTWTVFECASDLKQQETRSVIKAFFLRPNDGCHKVTLVTLSATLKSVKLSWRIVKSFLRNFPRDLLADSHDSVHLSAMLPPAVSLAFGWGVVVGFGVLSSGETVSVVVLSLPWALSSS
jgi:hypothetical protein